MPKNEENKSLHKEPNYKTCVYYKDNFCSSNVRFIQEATLDYLQTLEQWTENDVAVRQRERTNEHHPKPRRRKWLTRHYARAIVGKR